MKLKFWKGRAATAKEGQFGTMSDTGTVPDADVCTQAEYETWRAAQPVVTDTRKAEYAALTTDAQRIAYMAQQLGLV